MPSEVTHSIVHQFQPTATTCSRTALSILLSRYGRKSTPAEIEAKVPQVRNDQGVEQGTINVQLATWCIHQGFAVTLYSFDCQVIDQTWASLSPDAVLARLDACLSAPPVPSLGPSWSRAYREAFIEFIRAGGHLVILPYLQKKLLLQLLQSGPVLACVSYNILHGEGRKPQVSLCELVPDDVNGRALNHSIVIYGNTSDGSLLIADPWQKPGLHVIDAERIIAGISGAQMECDSMLFTITPLSSRN